MVKHSDASPEASLLARRQSRRLNHFRRALGIGPQDAAALANVSRFAWAHMEQGDRRVDMVALSRFLAAYERVPNLPGEYVLSGSTAGLPPDLARDLLELDRLEPPDFEEHSAPASLGIGDRSKPGIARKPRRKGKASNGTLQGHLD
jgi:hypothetical protein